MDANLRIVVGRGNTGPPKPLPTATPSRLVGLVTAVQSCIGIHQGIPGGEPLHWSDFWMYGVAPGVLYVGLACAALGLLLHAEWATLTTAGVLLALLLAAIRNAWDLVTFMAPRANEGAD